VTAHARLAARYFPNTSTRAYYSPRSLAVFLPEDDLDQALRRDHGAYAAWLAARLPLLTHEYQHSLDHVGTVAGRSLLDALAGAYFALERKAARDESELWRFVALHDAERRFDRKAYFTEYDPDYAWLDERRPTWQWGISTGLGFDAQGRPDVTDPLFFVRFTDVEQNSLVARQPITAAALFETRAVYAELEQDAHRIALAARDEPAVLEAWQREQQQRFYNPALTLYSAPAHFASSQCGAGDALDGYRMAAYAGGMILNLAPGLDIAPRLPDDFQDEASRPRFERLIELRDPGFLFVLLVASAPRYEGDVDAWLDAALAAAGFPPRERILDTALAHLAIPTMRTGSSFDATYLQAMVVGHRHLGRLRKSVGLLNFEVMTALGTNAGPIALPNSFPDQGIIPSPVEPLVAPREQLTLLEAEAVLTSQMDEFLRACR
jgi:hypothetical protein